MKKRLFKNDGLHGEEEKQMIEKEYELIGKHDEASTKKLKAFLISINKYPFTDELKKGE